jgi:hypothetical protein
MIYMPVTKLAPITVAAQSKAWNVFARSNTGIVGSNPNQGMDVCVYSVFTLPCVDSGFATGWSPVQGVVPSVLRLRNWSETKRFMDALCPKVRATEKRETERTCWKSLVNETSDLFKCLRFIFMTLL